MKIATVDPIQIYNMKNTRYGAHDGRQCVRAHSKRASSLQGQSCAPAVLGRLLKRDARPFEGAGAVAAVPVGSKFRGNFGARQRAD